MLLNDPEYLAAKREMCKRSLAEFIKTMDPTYYFNWHHIELISALEALRKREFYRLIVMMPPRHGKSTLVSVYFPAWAIGCDTDEQIITSSYAFSLASKMNRECKKVMSSQAYRTLFPEARIRQLKGDDVVAHNNSRKFEVVGKKGYYLSAGVMGGITGEGATIGIIDDPVKDAADADSIVMRNRAWDWYKTTFKSRFEPNAIEIVCQTRWHKDDLTGRILNQIKDSGARTKIISFPALCVNPNETHRKVGQALWETKYPTSVMKALSDPNNEEFIGSRTWNALYQQTPADDEGNLIKRHWFDWYDWKELDLHGLTVDFYFDTAYTDDEANDPTAGIAYVVDQGDFYILDCFSKWIDFNDQLKEIVTFAKRNGYSSKSRIRVEPKATGKSLVQVLKKGTKLNILEGLNPGESKVARVNSCSATLESGRVLLPRGLSWVEPFIDECATFPNAAHDDRVDCLTGMILNERRSVKKPRKLKTFSKIG